MVADLNAPPIQGVKEQRRVDEQRLRWRLMYGESLPDITARVLESLGQIRTDAVGPIDVSSNPMLSTWSGAAASYNKPPSLKVPEGGEPVAKAIEDSGYWSLMQRVQRDTLALREGLVRIDYDEDDEDGALSFRHVEPFLCEVKAHPRRPMKPVRVREWMPDPDDEDEWISVTCDVRRPAHPIYEARDADGHDISERVLGGSFNGENYPYRKANNQPLLPWVAYHAAITGRFWDYTTGKEVVEGTLNLAVHLTHYGHIIKDCSWAQRYAFGVEFDGAVLNEETGAMEMTTDASSVAMLRPREGFEGQAQIGQWVTPADPETVLRAVQSYERRIVDNALGTANVSRASSDIRSGFSLAVSKEDQKQLQESYAPVFSRSDLDLLRKCAALMGAPVDGWNIEYTAVPRDPRELAAQLDRITKAIEAGLMTKAEGYMKLHPMISIEDAQRAVDRIAVINAQAPEGIAA